jgi:TolB protein
MSSSHHTRTFARAVVTLALALVSVFAVVTTSSATTPGHNGRIAYKGYLDADRTTGAIFSVRPDGTRRRQLTRPATGTVDDQPDWSPNGALVAFRRCAPETVCAIYTVHSNGTHLRRLSAPCTATGPSIETKCADESDVAFMRDGHRVVLTRATGRVRDFPGADSFIEHSDIVIRDLSGRHARVVLRGTPFAGDNVQMVASPNGRRIAFQRQNSPLGKPANAVAVFVVRTNGSHLHRITPYALGAGDHPDWSPNGHWILVRSHADGDFLSSQLYLLRPSGRRLHPVTHVGADTRLLSSSFSPNGRRITLAMDGQGGEPDIFTIGLRSHRLRQITRTPQWESAPDWGAR